MHGLPSISIVGPGRVGTAIGILAQKAGYRVVAVGGRNRRRTSAAARRIGHSARPVTPAQAAYMGDIVLLTVSDEAIEPLCTKLARARSFRKGAIVAHCSGALGSEVLKLAKRLCGCSVGSMHPLQTFPTVKSTVKTLGGAYVFCEGDARAVRELKALAIRIGARTGNVESSGKALYHAATVTACNYLAGLVDAAMTMMRQAGVKKDTARRALEKILRTTLDNVLSMGTEKALTGPISRGDVGTVRRHLEAIETCPKELASVYRAMGVWTANVALRKGTISQSKAKALRRLLNTKR